MRPACLHFLVEPAVEDSEDPGGGVGGEGLHRGTVWPGEHLGEDCRCDSGWAGERGGDGAQQSPDFLLEVGVLSGSQIVLDVADRAVVLDDGSDQLVAASEDGMQTVDRAVGALGDSVQCCCSQACFADQLCGGGDGADPHGGLTAGVHPARADRFVKKLARASETAPQSRQ